MKVCRKPECGVDLVAGENWSRYNSSNNSYICQPCQRASDKKRKNSIRENDPPRYQQLLERQSTTRNRNNPDFSYKPRLPRGKYDKPFRRLLNSARTRAKANAIPFNITIDDITVPNVCPVLGLVLTFNTGYMADNSPTLDRIEPALGYVKGNVRVISWRANRIKTDATTDELLTVGYDLQKVLILRHYITAPSYPPE